MYFCQFIEIFNMFCQLPMSLRILFLWGLLVQIMPVSSFARFDLSGTSWIVTENISEVLPPPFVPAKVPGSQYTALYEAHLIGNPLYRDNDVLLAGIGRGNFTYETNFTVPSTLIASKHVNLVCEGLDTIATLYLNGKFLGKTDNMFVGWVYDISGMLKDDTNTLSIAFTSTVMEASSRANHSSYDIPPDCPPDVQHGECHVNQVRTEQCSFSWDWGPSFPTQGIWRPIYLESFDMAIVTELTAVVYKENDVWKVGAEAHFRVAESSKVTGTLQAEISGLDVTFTEDITISSDKPSHKFNISIPKTTHVPLWWPNGYGEQPLFTFNATFTCGGEQTSKTMRIGFRTVELVQQPVTNLTDSDAGLTFYFKVNGIPIFLKGSNWIPADSFQERITHDRLFYLLSSAANVSINSMRVWGGGIYESDDLYDICDELGILVWQDLMFSVALYPTTSDFLQSVATEVTQQLRRLKHHASILMWAGSNENEKALRQDWFNIKDNYTLYYKDYIKLYVTTIKPIIDTEDPSRVYLTSSPTDGAESVREGYVAQDPGSELYGDIHFYDYAADQWNASVFRIPRMASEYGIQAWCNNESLAQVFELSDFDVDSKMVDHRQHHGMGNVQMTAEVGLHLQFPHTTDAKMYFAEFIYLTQINQAMSIRTQTEHYRRHQSGILKDGRGLTMGALYWQLNDIWQAPTWASIDYEGRWKMLHYFARSFFSGHLISPYQPSPDILDIFVVIDEIPVEETRDNITGVPTMRPVTNLNGSLANQYTSNERIRLLQQIKSMTRGVLKIVLYQYSSFTPLHTWDVPYQTKTTAESVFTKSVQDLIKESGCPGPEHCFLHFTAHDTEEKKLSTNWFTFTYPKYAALKPATIMIKSVKQIDPTAFEVEISSDFPALFVWVSAGNFLGHFSDNGFLMVQPSVRVTFFSQQPSTASQLQAQLKVRSVRSNTAVPKPNNYNNGSSYDFSHYYVLPGIVASMMVNGSVV